MTTQSCDPDNAHLGTVGITWSPEILGNKHT